MVGTVAVDEILMHGWDDAVDTCDEELLRAAYVFAQAGVARASLGAVGLIGPPVQVSRETPLPDRLLGLTGLTAGTRRPEFRPPPSARSPPRRRATWGR
jgi:hypothetical protein